MLPDINKKCNKDIHTTTWHKKMLQLTLTAGYAKSSKTGFYYINVVI